MPTNQPAHPQNEHLGLALGGGGMKGVAHLGVLEALEQRGLAPGVLAGSSIGAVVGAFYAAGTPIREVFELAERASLWSLFSPRIDGRALVGVHPLRRILEEHFGDRRIESLAIHFAAVCTNLVTGEEVVLRSGSLVDAVLASAAIPGLFPPHRLNGQLLVDGALSNNVPVRPLVTMGATSTIAVQLFRRHSATTHENSRLESDSSLPFALPAWAERLLSKVSDEADPRPGMRMVLERSFELLLTRLEELLLETHPPDVLISPDVSDIGSLDFSYDREAVLLRGRAAVDRQNEALSALSLRLRTSVAPTDFNTIEHR
jgi:NTE family protein